MRTLTAPFSKLMFQNITCIPLYRITEQNPTCSRTLKGAASLSQGVVEIELQSIVMTQHNTGVRSSCHSVSWQNFSFYFCFAYGHTCFRLNFSNSYGLLTLLRNASAHSRIPFASPPKGSDFHSTKHTGLLWHSVNNRAPTLYENCYASM